MFLTPSILISTDLKTKLTDFVFHVFFPLLFGTCIYIFFRKASILGFDQLVGTNLLNSDIASSRLSTILIGSVPDFCWMYALLTFQTKIIWGSLKKIPVVLLTIICVAPIFSEYLQSKKLIPGTSDWADVVAYIFAILLNIFNQQYNQDATN